MPNVKTTFCIFLSIAFSSSVSLAQDEGGGTIKVTTRLLPDGTKAVLKTNIEEHTMESLTYDGSDKLKQRIVYMLDEQDQPMSGIIYAPNGQPAYKASYKHDQFGRIIEEADYTLNNQLIRRFVYEFRGKDVRVRAFDATGNELQKTAPDAPT